MRRDKNKYPGTWQEAGATEAVDAWMRSCAEYSENRAKERDRNGPSRKATANRDAERRQEQAACCHPDLLKLGFIAPARIILQRWFPLSDLPVLFGTLSPKTIHSYWIHAETKLHRSTSSFVHVLTMPHSCINSCFPLWTDTNTLLRFLPTDTYPLPPSIRFFFWVRKWSNCQEDNTKHGLWCSIGTHCSLTGICLPYIVEACQ